jgi:hypothetical protein
MLMFLMLADHRLSLMDAAAAAGTHGKVHLHL